MASDVMSLFGMDPNTIQQDRTNKAVSQASAMNPYFAVGAAGGSLMGQGINSAFGLQTADMAQAQGIQDSMDGFDLSTPQGMQQAAQQLMMNGNYAESMALHAKAAAMIKSDTTATNLLEDRSLGKSSNVIVKQAVAGGIGGLDAKPAIQHSITKHADGRFVDATQGKTFDTESDWLSSITELYGKAAADALAEGGGDSDVYDLSPSGSVDHAQQTIDSNVAALEEQLLFTDDESKIASLQEQIEDAKQGDPDGTERNIRNLKKEASVLYAELRSGKLKGFDRQNIANQIKLLKAHLKTLGATDSELSQLHKVTTETP
jgi:hypothetical protein